MSALTARTRVFTILGNPVEHSLSPVIQNAAFQETSVFVVVYDEYFGQRLL